MTWLLSSLDAVPGFLRLAEKLIPVSEMRLDSGSRNTRWIICRVQILSTIRGGGIREWKKKSILLAS